MKNIGNSILSNVSKRRNRAIKKAQTKIDNSVKAKSKFDEITTKNAEDVVLSKKQLNKIADQKLEKKVNSNKYNIEKNKKGFVQLKQQKEEDYSSKIAISKKEKTKKNTSEIATSKAPIIEEKQTEEPKQKNKKLSIWDDVNYDNTHIGNKRARLIAREQKKLDAYYKRREKNYQKALAEMELPDKVRDMQTMLIFNQLVADDKEAKESELKTAKDNHNQLKGRLDAYKEYYKGLNTMLKENKFVNEIDTKTQFDKFIEAGLISQTKTIKEKDISRLSEKEQKNVLEKIKKQFSDDKYSVYELAGSIIVDKKIDYSKEREDVIKKRISDAIEENKKTVERAKEYLDSLQAEYDEATKIKKEVTDRQNTEKKEIREQLKKEKEEDKKKKQVEKYNDFQTILDSLDYDFEVVDEFTIERIREIYDPKRMRNVKTKERITMKELLKEQAFIEKYNAEMEEIGWDNHKISYVELEKIMHNNGFTKYSQIQRPKAYQKKVRQRGIDNLFKSLWSAGLGNTDFYAFLQKHINHSNIDDIIGNMNEAEIYEIFGSDQQAVSKGLKKLVQSLKLSGDIKFRGRTLQEIYEEADEKML